MAKALEAKTLAPNQSNRWAKVSSQEAEFSRLDKTANQPGFPLRFPSPRLNCRFGDRSSESSNNRPFSGSEEPLRIYFP